MNSNVDNTFLEKIKYLCEILNISEECLATTYLAVSFRRFNAWKETDSCEPWKERVHNFYIACKNMEQRKISQKFFTSILHNGMVVYNEDEHMKYMRKESEEDDGSTSLIVILTAMDSKYVEKNLEDIIDEAILSYEEII